MCAQFMVKASVKRLARQFGLLIDEESIEWQERILPYQMAPVILDDSTARRLRLMQFSLIPNWSKERRVKFATHNARLLTYDEKIHRDVPIYEKPTWRSAFRSRRCLVPMTGFIEPLYSGELAGYMVTFSEASENVFAAAGLWEEWISKEDGEVIESFTIVTHNPIPLVKTLGHDRSPLFLREEGYQGWLEPGEKEPKEMMAHLLAHRFDPELSVEKDRPLKAGWEKRR